MSSKERMDEFHAYDSPPGDSDASKANLKDVLMLQVAVSAIVKFAGVSHAANCLMHVAQIFEEAARSKDGEIVCDMYGSTDEADKPLAFAYFGTKPMELMNQVPQVAAHCIKRTAEQDAFNRGQSRKPGTN